MISRDVQKFARDLAAKLKPRPPLNGLEYADLYFYVTGGSEGRSKFTPRPYQRDWFLSVTDPSVHCEICKKPARVGWSEYVKFVIQYYTHWRRGKPMIVHPTDEDSKKFTEEHIDNGLFHDTEGAPCLKGMLDKSGSKKALANNKSIKILKNGALIQLANAGSPSEARGVNRNPILLEEPSGYLSGKEGDIIWNFLQRAGTAVNPFFTIGGTPVHPGDYIEQFFLYGDQEFRYFPCPHCGTYDELFTRDAWKTFIYEGPDAGKKRCPHCQELIEYKHLRWMDEHGGWACPLLNIDRSNQILDDEGQPIWRSKQIGPGQSYHRGATWFELARRYRIAKEQLRQGNEEPMKTFRMTDMGLAWEPEFTSQITEEGLKARRNNTDHGNHYPPDRQSWEAPRGVVAITIGVDTQGGGGSIGEGFRIHVWGWGAGEESWHLAEMDVFGDPRQEETLDQLDAVAATVWHREDGAQMKALLGTVDEGGASTESVRRWCAKRVGTWVPVRGLPQPNAELLGRGKAADFNARNQPKNKPGRDILWYSVGYEASVNRWQAQLAVKAPGPGYVHLGMAASDQTLAELFPWKRVPVARGSNRYHWAKPRGARDEAGDCRRYAYAALQLVMRRYPRVDQMWVQLERQALASINGATQGQPSLVSFLKFS